MLLVHSTPGFGQPYGEQRVEAWGKNGCRIRASLPGQRVRDESDTPSALLTRAPHLLDGHSGSDDKFGAPIQDSLSIGSTTTNGNIICRVRQADGVLDVVRLSDNATLVSGLAGDSSLTQARNM